MMRGAAAVVVAALATAAAAPAGAPAQAPAPAPQVRLAAGKDCAANVNCIPGFKRVYKIDPTASFTPLKVADGGIQALDDGAAEVAVAFSSNPQLSRPDIITLPDDKHMISADHVVPIVRAGLLRRYGPALRRRFDEASRLLSTLKLRGLNQQVIDGRLPEAVGGGFADANGLGGPSPHRSGPLIRIGFQAFAEDETLAQFYGEALRGGGFRVRVRPAGGLRPAAVAGMRDNRIDMWPGYSGSLLGYLKGTSLKRSLARLGAQPLAMSSAQDRNRFAMKRDVARRLGIASLSDLARYWPRTQSTAARRAAPRATAAQDARQHEQWAQAPGSVLDLPGAWAITRGQGVTVAIVDSGARLEHPDLAPNIWTNFDEIPGNGIDDDHNGYVDDVHGVDLTTKSPRQNLADGVGHGTIVAGIVGAAQNRQGVVGVAPKVKLMIVRVLDDHGAGDTGAVAEGIRYAAANGARVINLSLGGDGKDDGVVAALQAAADANVLVVASAGNESRDIDSQPSYPAALPAPNLLAVASTDPDTGRDISKYSNYGRLAVQVAAPGAQILSTANDGGYAIASGTSMAAPMVTGVAALAAAANPGIGAVDLRALIMQNARRSGLPVAAGYVDALHTVLGATAVATGSSDTTRRPSVKILGATSTGRSLHVQVAVVGATAAVRRYRLKAGRASAQLAARPSPFTVTLRRRAARVTVEALDASGRRLASAHKRVIRQRAGKRGVGRGSGVST
jgi:subtilisin family serine protease